MYIKSYIWKPSFISCLSFSYLKEDKICFSHQGLNFHAIVLFVTNHARGNHAFIINEHEIPKVSSSENYSE